ncbi:hypothetical protein JD514_18305 [Aeromonas caviae]|uniref:P-loop ATPase, Sll1717 family n=1 Tax=Aeromonas caviae TaxID=648 RepID=UPI00191F6294|nr:hypothetical protein [Aeromonas caviae]MBL0499010.1 hypothetical protein [Aeromonas caviae]
MKNIDFNKIKWGPDDSKGDKDLPAYFFEIPEFSGIKDGKYRYVIGRKGTGKTAVIEKVASDADADPMSFYSSLSLRDFPLSIIRKLRDKTFKDKSQFVPVWKFLILIEICKHIISDEGAEPTDIIDELKDFLVKNFDINGFTIVDTLNTLNENNAKVKVDLKFLGGEAAGTNASTRVSEVHYNSVVSILEKKIRSVKTDSYYYVLFDELDEGYSARDKNQRLLLLSLLRAVEDTYLSLDGYGLKVRPLLALRSDIFDNLEDNDLNKLDDYIIRLQWTSSDDGPYSLYKLINKRIQTSFPDDVVVWGRVVNDNDQALPKAVGSVWKYIVNRTFERPRDLIKFLKLCGQNTACGPLLFENVLSAEDSFSRWFYNELRDEIHSHLPVWKECLQTITKIGRGNITKELYEEMLLKDKKINSYLEDSGLVPDDLIELLFDFSVLGNTDKVNGRWIFKYKDHDLIWDSEKDLRLHYGFTKKMRIKI